MSLALFGGKPVRKKFLPYARPVTSQKDVVAVCKVLQSDFLTTGPEIAKFESAFKQKLNCKYAIAISTGTAALHGAVRLLDLQAGDEVITSPMSFAATANAVVYEGGVIRFSDIDSDGNLCPATLANYIDNNYRKAGRYYKHKTSGGRLRAIIAVHYTGLVADMRSIHRLAEHYGIEVIEDAAHAIGACYAGSKRMVGASTQSLATTFSFHAVKHIATGEGGMICCASGKNAKDLFKFRNHGIDRDFNKGDNTSPFFFPITELGMNYRLSDIHCALGSSQLQRLSSMLKQRRSLATRYDKAFADYDLLTVPRLPKQASTHAWHIYVIQLQLKQLTANRDEIFQALRAENIGVNVHYAPIYHHPFYRNMKQYKAKDCPKVEAFYKSILTLPLFPAMSYDDVDDVVRAVHKVLAYYQS